MFSCVSYGYLEQMNVYFLFERKSIFTHHIYQRVMFLSFDDNLQSCDNDGENMKYLYL